MLVPNSSILEVTDILFPLAAPTEDIHNHLLTAGAIDCSRILAGSNIIMSSSSSTTPAVVAVAATSAVMGLIAGYFYRSVSSMKYREVRTLKVPKSLLMSPYGEELKLAVKLAMEGASAERNTMCCNRCLICFNEE